MAVGTGLHRLGSLRPALFEHELHLLVAPLRGSDVGDREGPVLPEPGEQ
uniref:Uncharacterized protein n=1 Tax=Arundo donax TaxID=35708 RepID=A0A0A9F2J9_ARUDO